VHSGETLSGVAKATPLTLPGVARFASNFNCANAARQIQLANAAMVGM
jgi:hypothetical protein